ncbi:hypothetical protein K438DRAFT_2006636 [Mycena galopus ATCC 62051]|nr:hypothetical protein K438DRAFT_2006636 [Mycena galopus ATCC 62051]
MVFTIPIELQECILDCLVGDISSLKACSLVCQAWGPTTRIHLHSRFTATYDISTDPDDPDFYPCRMYANQSLHLARYIREMDIQDGWGVLLEDGASELQALRVILDHTESLHRVSILTFRGGGSMVVWQKNSAQFRASLSAALQRSSSSLTHIFLYGFSFTLSDVEMFRGMRRLQYVGLERMGVIPNGNDNSSSRISNDETSRHLGSIQTLTLNFNLPDPANGPFVTGLINALHSVDVSHISNLRLGGVVNKSLLEALPPAWLTNLTHLGLELTNLNPSHPSSPLSSDFIAKVPTFCAVRVLELSLVVYPSVVPHDLSALELFMDQLLPAHRLDSIITTVTARGPVVYTDAVRRHYDYCVSRADVVKIQWEDGQIESLCAVFSALFANGAMQVGTFRRDKWIPW